MNWSAAPIDCKNKLNNRKVKITIMHTPELEILRASLVLRRPLRSEDLESKPFKRFRGSVAESINASFSAVNEIV